MVVLADSCCGFNLATPSSSVSYYESVPNRACQEGRNAAPVHATCPRRCRCGLSLWQDPSPGMTCFPAGLPSGAGGQVDLSWFPVVPVIWSRV